MHKEFDTQRYDLLDVDSVHIANHRFGRNKHGELDVWTTRGRTGTAFARRMTVDGTAGPVSQGVYTDACYFLRERATGNFLFLERDDRGFILQSDDFFGAVAYLGDEAVRVDAWIAEHSRTGPSTDANDGAAPLDRT